MSYVSKNFQAESKQSGDAFENLVEETLLFDNFQIIKKNYKIDELGIEVDFFCQKDGFNYYIEAKGGEKGPKKRPGAERTDNVKKAAKRRKMQAEGRWTEDQEDEYSLLW